MPREKVCLVGSGNWGSAIARIIGANTAAHPEAFEREIQMWVFEEVVGGKKLTEIINTTHENVKYLPGAKLPPNVVANPSLASAASGRRGARLSRSSKASSSRLDGRSSSPA